MLRLLLGIGVLVGSFVIVPTLSVRWYAEPACRDHAARSQLAFERYERARTIGGRLAADSADDGQCVFSDARGTRAVPLAAAVGGAVPMWRSVLLHGEIVFAAAMVLTVVPAALLQRTRQNRESEPTADAGAPDDEAR